MLNVVHPTVVLLAFFVTARYMLQAADMSQCFPRKRLAPLVALLFANGTLADQNPKHSSVVKHKPSKSAMYSIQYYALNILSKSHLW